MSDKKKILIICYAFPPYPGIGGRRWAKFAKYLNLQGNNVYVISSENPHKNTSEWTNDVVELPVIKLPLKYPRSLILFPKNILGRIRYKVDLIYVKMCTNGNYYDRTVFWKSQLISTASQLIEKKKIDYVIVSGAPFSLFNHITDLKMAYPKINLIADIRDPWTNNETAYAYDLMSKARLKYEQKIEASVFNHYDKVITVSDKITDYYKSIYKHEAFKFLTLPNGFDQEELNQFEEGEDLVDKFKINFVFTGTFYDKAIYLFKLLINNLNSLNKVELNLLEFHFFGIGMEKLEKYVPTDMKSLFNFGYFNDLNKVNRLIFQCDYTMLFLTDDINYSLSTKFCEYIKFKKKIVLFSKSGWTSDFIKSNQIGFHIDESNFKLILKHLIYERESAKLFPSNFNVDAYSIKSLTNKLIQIID